MQRLLETPVAFNQQGRSLGVVFVRDDTGAGVDQHRLDSILRERRRDQLTGKALAEPEQSVLQSKTEFASCRNFAQQRCQIRELFGEVRAQSLVRLLGEEVTRNLLVASLQ